MTIQYTLPGRERAILSIYDVMGRRVAKLVDGVGDVGPHTALWNLRDHEGNRVRGGVYFIRLLTVSHGLTRPTVVLP